MASTQAVSVCLPTWSDAVGWVTQKPRVIDAMTTGYPRFFVPRVVQRLAARIMPLHSSMGAETTNTKGDQFLIFPSRRYARLVHQVLCREHSVVGSDRIVALSVTWGGIIQAIDLERSTEDGGHVSNDSVCATPQEPLTPPPLAQHIISGIDKEPSLSKQFPTVSPQVVLSHDEAYEGQSGVAQLPSGTENIFLISFPKEMFPTAKAVWQHTGFGISSRRATYWLENAPFLSERPSFSSEHNLKSKTDTNTARAKIRARISAGYSSECLQVNQTDVFLYPTGMTAITEAAIAVQSIRSQNPCVVAVFG